MTVRGPERTAVSRRQAVRDLVIQGRVAIGLGVRVSASRRDPPAIVDLPQLEKALLEIVERCGRGARQQEGREGALHSAGAQSRTRPSASAAATWSLAPYSATAA